MNLLLSLGTGILDGFGRPHATTDPFSFFSFFSVQWLIGPIITVVVLVLVIVPRMRRSAARGKLLQTGEAANAKILALHDMGVRINNDPELQIVLEIYPSNGRPPFQSTCTLVVSYLAIPRIQPGMIVPVKFDPQNPSNVALAV